MSFYLLVRHELDVKPDSKDDFRYYKCIKNTCNKVSEPNKDTINIPAAFPESFDTLLIRYHLKTFFPLTIRCSQSDSKQNIPSIPPSSSS